MLFHKNNCGQEDLNFHASRHQHLKLTCLPVPPWPHKSNLSGKKIFFKRRGSAKVKMYFRRGEVSPSLQPCTTVEVRSSLKSGALRPPFGLPLPPLRGCAPRNAPAVVKNGRRPQRCPKKAPPTLLPYASRQTLCFCPVKQAGNGLSRNSIFISAVVKQAVCGLIDS